MRCSVVVATRDRHELLAKTLPRHEAPVIVVDNASEDPIPGAIRLPRNLGGAGRNVGVQAAGTDYVALTDDDAWWEPGALASAIEWMDAHPHVALLQPKVLVGAEQRLDPVCAELAEAPYMLGFVACAVVVRRVAFLSVGGFHERLAVGGEEELLAWDLAAAGWELAYVPEVVARHCPPGGNRPRRREVQLRNALLTPWLRRPWPVALRGTVSALRSAPREPASARAVVRALAGLPWVLRERQPGPPHVEAMRRRLSG